MLTEQIKCLKKSDSDSIADHKAFMFVKQTNEYRSISYRVKQRIKLVKVIFKKPHIDTDKS